MTADVMLMLNESCEARRANVRSGRSYMKYNPKEF
jgi:hypothetical protein